MGFSAKCSPTRTVSTVISVCLPFVALQNLDWATLVEAFAVCRPLHLC
jgi:hypothetical protein